MPPAKKKAARKKPIAPPRAKPKATSRRLTSRPKPAARRATPKPKAARRTASKSKPRARAPRYVEPEQRPSLVSLEEDAAEQPSLARAIGVGSESPMRERSDAPPTEPIAVPQAAEEPKDTAPHLDRPLAELASGAFALLLAISVFVPWYHNVIGTVSGWSSGTWGPIVFFAALTSLAIVVLRRAGVAIEFPVEPTLLVEGIGWLCVIGLILKRYFAPQVAGAKLPTDGWIFASLVCALGLAVTAGWASSNAPFVIRKTWFHDRAGQIGSGVLALAIVGGLSFGFANTVPTVSGSSTGPPIVAPQLTRGLPKCAGRLHIPKPPGFTATQGYDFKNQPTTCVAYFSTSLKLDVGFSRFVAALRAAGWTVTFGKPTPVSRTAGIKGPGCGAMTMIIQSGRPTTAYLNVLPCPRATPKK